MTTVTKEPKRVVFAVVAVAAVVGLVALAHANDHEPRGASATDVAVGQQAALDRGDYHQAYGLVHPKQRAKLNEEAFVACHLAPVSPKATEYTLLSEVPNAVDVPGTDLMQQPGRAVKFAAGQRGGQQDIRTTDVVEVEHGVWRAVMPYDVWTVCQQGAR